MFKGIHEPFGKEPDRKPSDEELALLLEGKLDPERRSRVLEALASSPDELELYAHVVAVERELEDEASTVGAPESSTNVVSIGAAPSARRRRTKQLLPFAAAALLLIAVGVPIWQRVGPGASLGSPASTLALLSAGSNAPVVPPSAFDVTRGAGDNGATTGRGVRVGVGIADALLLSVSRDSASAGAFARTLERVARELDQVPAGVVVGQAFRELARQPIDDSTAARLARASDMAEQFVGAREVRVGAWLTALRAAALRNDTTFVVSRAQAGMRAAQQLADAREGAPLLVDEMRRAVSTRPVDWVRVVDAAAAVSKVLGR